ncbi:MAG TPA: transglycosylase domain-containing protein [Streptosporangiaceae bacterium]|nr:transglycosylase domain-containing protein [Streptosporangiaceae bacterium]
MLLPVRRAGALPETVVRLLVVTAAAALLVAASVIPVVTIAGIAARDTAKTFNELSVGKLGAAPVRSVLYDSQGNVITYLYPYDVYRVPVSYEQVAPVMRNAIVAIEDSSFYSQGALDPRGTVRALLHNSGNSGLQGASTIAQQYVKNVKVLQAGTNQDAISKAIYPDLRRKIQDLRLAADVEHVLTQNELLASYLNVAYFANHAWGIEVASEVYFSEHASQLTLPQAALLAGIVQYPTLYDPVAHPGPAKDRRNTVLQRMWQLHYISHATYLAAAAAPIVLHRSYAPLHTGCTSPQAANAAFFCDYVTHVLRNSYPAIWRQINNSGDLAIYTTMSTQDQRAADNAVNHVLPPNNPSANPGNNADTEVLIQPGTGAIRAIAVNRPYGSGPGQDSIDYAVNSQYGGDPYGVQTGSSSKIFTLITALEQGYPFGHKISIQNPETVGPFFSCSGGYVVPHPFANAEAAFKGSETYMLGEATVESVNTYFVNLEKQVGLCNVVKTAVAMGMTRADGTPLLEPDKNLGLESADWYSSFTLGSVGVSPMSMAGAYATVAAGGVYCSPQAIVKVQVMSTGQQLPTKPNVCHQAIPSTVAAAANYILQRVLQPPGTAAGRDSFGHTAAAKTGTADGGFYAAFAGWTPTLAGYVSVFNPSSPTTTGAMVGAHSCYASDPLYGYSSVCPGQMFGDNAPGATWEWTFLHANLGANLGFPNPPGSYFSEGGGFGAPTSSCNPPNTGATPTPNPSPSPGCTTGPKRGPPTPTPTKTP